MGFLGGTFVKKLAIGFILGQISKKLQPKPKPAQRLPATFGSLPFENFIDTDAPIPVIYGRRRIGGGVIYQRLIQGGGGTYGDLLSRFIVLSEGPIHGLYWGSILAGQKGPNAEILLTRGRYRGIGGANPPGEDGFGAVASAIRGERTGYNVRLYLGRSDRVQAFPVDRSYGTADSGTTTSVTASILTGAPIDDSGDWEIYFPDHGPASRIITGFSGSTASWLGAVAGFTAGSRYLIENWLTRQMADPGATSGETVPDTLTDDSATPTALRTASQNALSAGSGRNVISGSSGTDLPLPTPADPGIVSTYPTGEAYGIADATSTTTQIVDDALLGAAITSSNTWRVFFPENGSVYRDIDTFMSGTGTAVWLDPVAGFGPGNKYLIESKVQQGLPATRTITFTAKEAGAIISIDLLFAGFSAKSTNHDNITLDPTSTLQPAKLTYQYRYKIGNTYYPSSGDWTTRSRLAKSFGYGALKETPTGPNYLQFVAGAPGAVDASGRFYPTGTSSTLRPTQYVGNHRLPWAPQGGFSWSGQVLSPNIVTIDVTTGLELAHRIGDIFMVAGKGGSFTVVKVEMITSARYRVTGSGGITGLTTGDVLVGAVDSGPKDDIFLGALPNAAGDVITIEVRHTGTISPTRTELANFLGSETDPNNPGLTGESNAAVNVADYQAEDYTYTRGMIRAVALTVRYQSVYLMPHVAYEVADLYSDPMNGSIPNISSVIEGRTIPYFSGPDASVADKDDFTLPNDWDQYIPDLNNPVARVAGHAGHMPSSVAVNNPADCILDWLRNKRYGVGLDEDQINFASFALFHDYCEEQFVVLSNTTYPNANSVVGTATGGSKTRLEDTKLYDADPKGIRSNPTITDYGYSVNFPTILEGGEPAVRPIVAFDTDAGIVFWFGELPVAVTAGLTYYISHEEPLFQFDCLIGDRRQKIDWVQSMLDSCRAFLVYEDGMYSIRPYDSGMVNGVLVSAFDFERDHIVTTVSGDKRESTLRVSYTSDSEIPNRVTVTFANYQMDYVTDTAVADDQLDQEQRGIHPREFTLVAVVKKSQAVREARFILDRLRSETKTFSWRAGPEASAVRPGDIVTVYYPEKGLGVRQLLLGPGGLGLAGVDDTSALTVPDTVWTNIEADLSSPPYDGYEIEFDFPEMDNPTSTRCVRTISSVKTVSGVTTIRWTAPLDGILASTTQFRVYKKAGRTPLRVVEVREQPNDEIELACALHAPEIYANMDTYRVHTNLDPAFAEPPGKLTPPLDPTSVQVLPTKARQWDGTTTPTLRVMWLPGNGQDVRYVKGYQVEYTRDITSSDDGAKWDSLGRVEGSKTRSMDITLPNLALLTTNSLDGIRYRFRVRSVGFNGLMSNGNNSTGAIDAFGNDAPPPDVPWISADFAGGNKDTVSLRWGHVDAPGHRDVIGYRIQLGSVWKTGRFPSIGRSSFTGQGTPPGAQLRMQDDALKSTAIPAPPAGLTGWFIYFDACTDPINNATRRKITYYDSALGEIRWETELPAELAVGDGYHLSPADVFAEVSMEATRSDVTVGSYQSKAIDYDGNFFAAVTTFVIKAVDGNGNESINATLSAPLVVDPRELQTFNFRTGGGLLLPFDVSLLSTQALTPDAPGTGRRLPLLSSLSTATGNKAVELSNVSPGNLIMNGGFDLQAFQSKNKLIRSKWPFEDLGSYGAGEAAVYEDGGTLYMRILARPFPLADRPATPRGHPDSFYPATVYFESGANKGRFRKITHYVPWYDAFHWYEPLPDPVMAGDRVRFTLTDFPARLAAGWLLKAAGTTSHLPDWLTGETVLSPDKDAYGLTDILRAVTGEIDLTTDRLLRGSQRIPVPSTGGGGADITLYTSAGTFSNAGAAKSPKNPCTLSFYASCSEAATLEVYTFRFGTGSTGDLTTNPDTYLSTVIHGPTTIQVGPGIPPIPYRITGALCSNDPAYYTGVAFVLKAASDHQRIFTLDDVMLAEEEVAQSFVSQVFFGESDANIPGPPFVYTANRKLAPLSPTQLQYTRPSPAPGIDPLFSPYSGTAVITVRPQRQFYALPTTGTYSGTVFGGGTFLIVPTLAGSTYDFSYGDVLLQGVDSRDISSFNPATAIFTLASAYAEGPVSVKVRLNNAHPLFSVATAKNGDYLSVFLVEHRTTGNNWIVVKYRDQGGFRSILNTPNWQLGVTHKIAVTWEVAAIAESTTVKVKLVIDGKVHLYNPAIGLPVNLGTDPSINDTTLLVVGGVYDPGAIAAALSIEVDNLGAALNSWLLIDNLLLLTEVEQYTSVLSAYTTSTLPLTDQASINVGGNQNTSTKSKTFSVSMDLDGSESYHDRFGDTYTQYDRARGSVKTVVHGQEMATVRYEPGKARTTNVYGRRAGIATLGGGAVSMLVSLSSEVEDVDYVVLPEVLDPDSNTLITISNRTTTGFTLTAEGNPGTLTVLWQLYPIDGNVAWTDAIAAGVLQQEHSIPVPGEDDRYAVCVQPADISTYHHIVSKTDLAFTYALESTPLPSTIFWVRRRFGGHDAGRIVIAGTTGTVRFFDPMPTEDQYAVKLQPVGISTGTRILSQTRDGFTFAVESNPLGSLEILWIAQPFQ